MKTAILLLLISVLQLSAATVSFSNIPATNVVKATDLLLLDSALGGTNYSTRTLTVSNLANVVAAPVGTVVASGTPASTNTFFAPSDFTGTNAVPRAILAADIATSIVTGKQTNATLASLGGVTTNAPNIAAGAVAAFSSSNVLGAATSAQLQSALGNVYQSTNSNLSSVASSGAVLKTGGTDNTGTLYFPFLSTGQYQTYWDAVTTQAGTYNIDWGLTNAHVLQSTGNITFTFSGLASNRSFVMKLYGNSTNSTITWPANIHGGPATFSTAGKVMSISGVTDGSNATNATVATLEDN